MNKKSLVLLMRTVIVSCKKEYISQKAIYGAKEITEASTATPLDSSGIPLFKNVWIYMCFPK